jgi:hypothetical protein
MLCTDSKGTKSLSDYQSLILSRILFASFNCFKEGSNKAKSKSVESCEAHVKVFSDTLATKLPDLLERFLADTNVTRQLLEISILVNVESYSNTRQSKKFKKLLTQLRNAFETHSEASVLKTVAAALQHLSSTSHGRQSDVVSEISSLATNLVSRLDDDDEEEKDEDVSKLLCLRRLQFLLCWIDVTQIVSSKEDTIKTLENMLQDCVSDIKSETSIRIMQELPGVMTLWYVMSLTSFSLMSRCWKKLFVIDYSFEKNTHTHTHTNVTNTGTIGCRESKMRMKKRNRRGNKEL